MKQKLEKQNNGKIVLYQPDEVTNIEVTVENETVWLSQAQMAELYGTQRQAISKHIRNIYNCSELEFQATCSILELLRKEGNRMVRRSVEFYNLDMIISVGYRVNTNRGIKFRQWANNVLKEHLLKGYSVNRQLVAIQERTDERFLQIQQQLDDQRQKVDFLVMTHTQSDEKLFPNGCVFDAWVYLSELVKKAKKRIILIDNYCDERTLALLTKRATGVTAVIHSRYSAPFEEDLNKHNAQYPDASIEFIQLPHKEHDRFLIIDDDVYMLGDSIKDLGHSLTAVLKTRFSAALILAEINTHAPG